VTQAIASFDDLFKMFKTKFGQDECMKEMVTYHMKDKDYGVDAVLEDVKDLYDGAVVTVKPKQSTSRTDANTLKRQLEEMKRKLAAIEEGQASKRQRCRTPRNLHPPSLTPLPPPLEPPTPRLPNVLLGRRPAQTRKKEQIWTTRNPPLR
jgi:hypothetical protein